MCSLKAQTDFTITGKLFDDNGQAVMYANVALLSCADSSIIVGTVSDSLGSFKLKYNRAGVYYLSVSFIGFKPYSTKVELINDKNIELKNIVLKTTQTELNEIVITQKRLKAKQQLNKITYYVNHAMVSNSNTGIDILKQIPNIQVDLLQNISINGSQNILILVNGIERNAQFLSQIHPSKIDRIEVKNTPGVQYKAEVTGVINVILKKNKNTGVNGHVYLNIPTANDEVFSFPSASLNISFKKLTLYTSYNGAFSYFDIKAEDIRSFQSKNAVVTINKTEDLYQQNWSHKIHFGADYLYNEKNQLNVYSFISRFSNQQSGNFQITKLDNEIEERKINYLKKDYDINTSAYASVYYKHIFNKNTELSFDANYYLLQSENRLGLKNENLETENFSFSKPNENMLNTHLNVCFKLNNNTGINTGIEQNRNQSSDRSFSDFNYIVNTSAAYISVNYSNKKFQINAGTRAEYLRYSDNNQLNSQIVILPTLHLKYSFDNKKYLQATYKKGIIRPTIFQLNPNVVILDSYLTQNGNPDLVPTINHKFSLDYGLSFGNSFLKNGLFYGRKTNAIENLTLLNNDHSINKEVHNLGTIVKMGFTTSGSLQLHKNISLNPYLRIYHVQTKSNKSFKKYLIQDKQGINYNSALSTIFTMNNNLFFSFSLQHSSHQIHIQNDYCEDVLYFISVDKMFFDRLKIGITSAIPFKKYFTYQSYHIQGLNLSQNTQDNIKMSMFPVWIKLNYTFASGKKSRKFKQPNSFNENRNKKGF